MKSSTYLALAASVAMLWGGLTGCTENPLDDPDPPLSQKLPTAHMPGHLKPNLQQTYSS